MGLPRGGLERRSNGEESYERRKWSSERVLGCNQGEPLLPVDNNRSPDAEQPNEFPTRLRNLIVSTIQS